VEYPKGNGQMFKAVPMQNTHWYRLGGREGCTANPRYAPQAEVKRVGLHDCDVLRCASKHVGTKADYEKRVK